MTTPNILTNQRRANPATQLEVNIAILDYLLFTATRAVLLDFRPSSNRPEGAIKQSTADMPLQLVDAFLVVFRAIHPEHQRDADLQFRLRLLKFAVLFTRRSRASAPVHLPPIRETVRVKQRRQSNAFKSDNIHPASLDPRNISRHSMPNQDIIRGKRGGFPRESTNQTTTQDGDFLPMASLLDTLPAFMALSAAENAMQESRITEMWMRLAAGYMAQAVAEQYLDYGSEQQDVLQEAFAWGFDAETPAEEGSDDWMINAMFWGDHDEVAGWEEIRNEHMRALMPPEGSGLLDHLKTLRENELSLREFEHCLLLFLDGLLHSQPRPILAQLESDKIDGLSRKDTIALQERLGIS